MHCCTPEKHSFCVALGILTWPTAVTLQWLHWQWTWWLLPLISVFPVSTCPNLLVGRFLILEILALLEEKINCSAGKTAMPVMELQKSYLKEMKTIKRICIIGKVWIWDCLCCSVTFGNTMHLHVAILKLRGRRGVLNYLNELILYIFLKNKWLHIRTLCSFTSVFSSY